MNRQQLKEYILEKQAGSYDLYNLDQATTGPAARYSMEKGFAINPDKLNQIRTSDAYMNSQYGYQKTPEYTKGQRLQMEIGNSTHRLAPGEVKSKAKITNPGVLVGQPYGGNSPQIKQQQPKANTLALPAPSSNNATTAPTPPTRQANGKFNAAEFSDYARSQTPKANATINGKKIVNGDKSYRYPEVGRSNKSTENATKGAKENLEDKAKKAAKNNTNTKAKGSKVVEDAINDGAKAKGVGSKVGDTVKNVGTTVKSGGKKVLKGVKKGGKLAIIGTGIGLGVAGGKALLDNKQQPQDDEQRLATYTVIEDGMEKQAIAFSGVRGRDIPKTNRKEKKQAKKFYKSLPKDKRREFLNEVYKEKAKMYNRYDRSKDEVGNVIAGSVPSIGGSLAMAKGHDRLGNVLGYATLPGFAGQINSYIKDSKAENYAKKKTMDKMLGIKEREANIFDNDMEKQAIAFSGKKLRNIPKTSKKEKKEVRQYYKTLSPEDKRRFNIGADIGSLKYYDAYDRNKDRKGNAIVAATVLGAPLGMPGILAASMKENRAVDRSEYDQMKKMKAQSKEASELLDALYKQASLQGVSGLSNATNAVSPFAKATLKDTSTTPSLGGIVNNDISTSSVAPKPPKTSDTTSIKTDSTDANSSMKQAEEVINSFEQALEKTASEFLGLTPEELKPVDSEYMANKRRFVNLFNSPNIKW